MALIDRYMVHAGQALMPPDPAMVGFITDPLARAHEFTWHRLAAAIERSPDDNEPWEFGLDWEAIACDWSPPVYFALNLMEFPPALKR